MAGSTSQVSAKLVPGEPLFFRGRVSLREAGRHQNGAGAGLYHRRSAKAPRPPARRRAGKRGGSGKPAAERPQKGGRLLIRRAADGGRTVGERLQLLFSIFEGETPLLVRAADTGRLLKAGEEYNTDANPVLLGELRRVLGQAT